MSILTPPVLAEPPRRVLRTTGATFTRRTGIFFPALTYRSAQTHLTSLRRHGIAADRCLIPYNEMPGSRGSRWWENTSAADSIGTLADDVRSRGFELFLDSGIFTFCQDYGRAHGIPGAYVFSYAEEQFEEGIMPSYERHYGDYVKRMEALLWGAVEIDLGTLEQRRARRERMRRSQGVTLIPVFRPETDPLEELDNLMRTYDRVCVPVTVKFLPTALRWKLIEHAVFLQRTKYPYCYLHVLGSAPTHHWLSVAAFSGSCDASTWTAPVRYGVRCTHTLNYSVQLKLKTFQNANPGESPVLFRDLNNPQGTSATTALSELYLATMSTFVSSNLTASPAPPQQ